jgi:hypothetical protein
MAVEVVPRREERQVGDGSGERIVEASSGLMMSTVRYRRAVPFALATQLLRRAYCCGDGTR